ncbi:MAG: helix-turn-helix domain-containing protein [Desulfurococcus sp.]|uniref:helix-turn-helix domain-containing protein n=1 Tax=Desulfurococcus sp. TaxID=51678 RepID=UPI003D122860
MGEHYLGTTEFARILDVSRVTVIKWIKSGRITVYNVNGRWRIPYSEVERVLKCVQRIKRVAIYARVSSSTQRSDLSINRLKPSSSGSVRIFLKQST